jgi:hypothetical protein
MAEVRCRWECGGINSPLDEFCARCKQRLWTDCTKCGEANEHCSKVCSLCGELTEYGVEVEATRKQQADEVQQRKEAEQRGLDEVEARREEARRNNPAIAAADAAREKTEKTCLGGCLTILFGVIVYWILGLFFFG